MRLPRWRSGPKPSPETVALVTGASSGIGADFARALAARNPGRIVLVARRRDRLEALARELGSVALVRAVDLTAPEQVDALVRDEPRVDILVNNAGFGWGDLFVRQADPTQVDRLLAMVDLNCRAVVRLTAAWVPGMVERGQGWILNVGSIAGLLPVPTMGVYGATKAFVHSFTEALRVELRGTGVQVHLLAPGPVTSEFFEVAHPGVQRPPARAFLDSRRVADEALDALFRDRPRLVPGLHVRLGAMVASSLPSGAYRPLARLVSWPARRRA